jgi:hypothetical protein
MLAVAAVLLAIALSAAPAEATVEEDERRAVFDLLVDLSYTSQLGEYYKWGGTLAVCAWGAVTVECDGDGRITKLLLMGQYTTGTIPSTISTLGRLTQLSLGGNGFTGTIPSTIGALTDLKCVLVLLSCCGVSQHRPPALLLRSCGFASLTSARMLASAAVFTDPRACVLPGLWR